MGSRKENPTQPACFHSKEKRIAFCFSDDRVADTVAQSIHQRDTGFSPVTISGKTPRAVASDCAAAGVDILMMEVAPVPRSTTLTARLETARMLREQNANTSIYLICDGTSFPDLVSGIQTAKDQGSIDNYLISPLTTKLLLELLDDGEQTKITQKRRM